MVNSNSKGAKTERECVNCLDEEGWTVLRAPASGSATVRDLPDVFAGKDGHFVCIEMKASSGNPIYIDETEVAALRAFAEAFGGDVRIGARFDEQPGDPTYGNSDVAGIYFLKPETLYRTGRGNYRIKKETALERGVLYTAL